MRCGSWTACRRYLTYNLAKLLPDANGIQRVVFTAHVYRVAIGFSRLGNHLNIRVAVFFERPLQIAPKVEHLTRDWNVANTG